MSKSAYYCVYSCTASGIIDNSVMESLISDASCDKLESRSPTHVPNCIWMVDGGRRLHEYTRTT